MLTRHVFRAALLSLCLSVSCSVSIAAVYPERSVRFVVPYSPGGGTDVIGRVLAEKMTQLLGKTFIVDNRPGGGGMIGAEIAAKSTPDGHTLLIGTSAEFTISPALFGKVPYDPVADFWPIALLGTTPVVLVANLKFPPNDVRELIAHAKAHPGKISVGVGGAGGAPHLGAELLKTTVGIDVILVPFKGGGETMASLIGGQNELASQTVAAVMPFLKTNRVKALAVVATKRTQLLPDVPAIAEQGVPNLETVTWFGLFVPVKTPKPVVETLRAAIDTALKDKEIQGRLAVLGIDSGSVENGGAVLIRRIKTELPMWERVIRNAGIKTN